MSQETAFYEHERHYVQLVLYLIWIRFLAGIIVYVVTNKLAG